jgi:hypothetical protein
VALLLLTVLGAGGLWRLNTASITTVATQGDVIDEPGQSVKVTLAQCMGPVVRLRRQGLFERWQQTHLNGERSIRPWYSLRAQSVSSVMPCVSEFTVMIPADVTWSPIAACDVNDNCFLIRVEYF